LGELGAKQARLGKQPHYGRARVMLALPRVSAEPVGRRAFRQVSTACGASNKELLEPRQAPEGLGLADSARLRHNSTRTVGHLVNVGSNGSPDWLANNNSEGRCVTG